MTGGMEATKARPEKLRVLHYLAGARELSPRFQTGKQGVPCQVNETAEVSEVSEERKSGT